MKAGLKTIKGVELPFDSSSFHELVFTTSLDAETVLASMAGKNILAGLAIEKYYPQYKNAILVCVTETKNDRDIAQYLESLKQIIEEAA